MKKLRILIVDDHEIARHGIRLVIEQEVEWEVCGEASDGCQAVALAARLAPDVVVMDLGLREIDGLEATRQIKRAIPQTEVVIYTGDGSGERIGEVFAAGARSYILKPESGQQLIAAIRALAEHKPYFTPSVSEILFARSLENASAPTEELTFLERGIVELVCKGKSHREAGELLGISARSVETHRALLMRKLHLDSFANLIRYAVRHKIVAA